MHFFMKSKIQQCYNDEQYQVIERFIMFYKYMKFLCMNGY